MVMCNDSDTSLLDTGSSVLHKIEESSKLENNSAVIDTCDEERSGDAIEISCTDVSRKCEESKKLIWEVHSDTFIKSTKKTGWKVCDKISEPHQKENELQVIANTQKLSCSQQLIN